MARDVFIVACLELGLYPDLSQVRWNLGGIDLSHFGLGDQLVGALAARYALFTFYFWGCRTL